MSSKEGSSRAQSHSRRAVRNSGRTVGKSVERNDLLQKVTGEAEYGSDLEVEGMLYGAVVRSNRPHARLLDVDTDAVEAIEGVEAVVSRQELLGMYDDRLRHYGDVIAAVAAEDLTTAKEAAKTVSYEVDSLDAVFDPNEAIRDGAPRLHENNVDIGQHTHPFQVENEEWVQNIDDYHSCSIGNTEDGFDQADYTLERTYTSPRVTHCNLDTHCTIAEWDGETLVLTETLTSPNSGSHKLARFMGLDAEQIEIRMPPTGSSSFGGRSLPKLTLEPVAATLAQETDRPVKLWWDREEEFAAGETRHETEYAIKMGVSEDGDITAAQTTVVTDTGAYPNGIGHVVLWMSLNRLLDLYNVPNYAYEGVSVFTNNIPAGEYRGIGSTQFWFAMDSHMDELARTAGLDPYEFRRQNHVDETYENPATGSVNDSSGGHACLTLGQKRFEELSSTAEDGSDALYGRGLSVAVHPTAGTIGEVEGASDSSEVELSVRADGRIRAKTGAVEQGQGSDTVVAQIISEETGIPVSLIDVERFSTAADLTDDHGSIASRTTYIVGAAAYSAARNLLAELERHAANEVGVDPAAVTIKDGHVRWPDGSMVIQDLLQRTDDEFSVVGQHETSVQPPSYGAHFAEVAIDPGTGKVDLRTYVAAQDVGYAINPKGVEGQLEGAVLHGVEFALFSDVELDQGSPQNANFADYAAINAWEMPEQLETVIVESNEEAGPYGAKGVGTPSSPPVAPAVLNALRDATGHRFSEPPVTSEDVYNVLHQ